MPTDFGPILVAVQGDTRKAPIFTYHDIGLNREFYLLVCMHVSMAPLTIPRTA